LNRTNASSSHPDALFRISTVGSGPKLLFGPFSTIMVSIVEENFKTSLLMACDEVAVAEQVPVSRKSTTRQHPPTFNIPLLFIDEILPLMLMVKYPSGLKPYL
jgi:hypothetical protein